MPLQDENFKVTRFEDLSPEDQAMFDALDWWVNGDRPKQPEKQKLSPAESEVGFNPGSNKVVMPTYSYDEETGEITLNDGAVLSVEEAAQLSKPGIISSLPTAAATNGSGLARRVRTNILYDGELFGLDEHLTALSYTDNAEGRSDEIQLTFEDADALWLMQKAQMPEKEHELNVTMIFENWNAPGVTETYHCGNFIVDDISFSGPQLTCTIKGVSTPADEGFNTTPHSQTWENTSLKQILEEKMADYGLTELYWYGDDIQIDTIEQKEQTDSAFLAATFKKYGRFLKVYNTGAAAFDKKVYEARPAKTVYGTEEIISWSYNSTLAGTYTGGNLKYTKAGSKDKEATTLDVTVGDGPRILCIHQSAKDEAEAREVIISKVNAENEKAETFSANVLPHVLQYASDNFLVAGLGDRVNGLYFTQSVAHSLSGGKYTCKISGYKIFKRL